MPDLECSYWPDIWFGTDLGPCCRVHDVSALDFQSSIDLGACVVSAMAGTHPVAGFVLGALMFAGTAVWCGLKYGARGKSQR